MRIVSIDIALKSLAIIVVDVDLDKFKIDNSDTYHNVEVIHSLTANLAPNTHISDINTMDIIRLIANYINDNIVSLIDSTTTVLVEKQIPSTPSFISYISALTVLQGYDVHIINPAMKNQLNIGGHTIAQAYEKTISSYKANKEHCRQMFKFIKDNIKGDILYDKKMETDIADAFCQMFAYLRQLG